MIDLVQRYEKILSFLSPYRELWQGEILNEFPRIYAPEIEDWAKNFEELSSKEKAERLSFYSPLNDEKHKKLISEIKQLIELPSLEIKPSKVIHKVTQKKGHEISQIESFYQDKKLARIYDFAGGVGHTSEYLEKNLNIQCTCLDLDSRLIETGQTRADKVEFKVFEIKKDMKLELNLPADLLGLHCCGDLSQNLIDYFSESKASSLLNLGCCYHKIESHQDFSHQARYLATRSHGVISESQIKEREQFKTYRYSFELFLKEFYHTPSVATLKSSLPELYQGSFEKYALEQLERLNLKPIEYSKIKSFFEDLETQKQVKRLINLGHVRAPFGRTIEIALILKRAIELRKKGYQVEVFELFNRALSPRNIAIYAF